MASSVVVSGVARPEFGIDDDHVHRELCRVRLRVPVTRMKQSTEHVSRASVSNDESAYGFATDDVSLEMDEAGELVPFTHLALMGESSTLNRFSHQVVVIDHAVVTEVPARSHGQARGSGRFRRILPRWPGRST